MAGVDHERELYARWSVSVNGQFTAVSSESQVTSAA